SLSLSSFLPPFLHVLSPSVRPWETSSLSWRRNVGSIVTHCTSLCYTACEVLLLTDVSIFYDARHSCLFRCYITRNIACARNTVISEQCCKHNANFKKRCEKLSEREPSNSSKTPAVITVRILSAVV